MQQLLCVMTKYLLILGNIHIRCCILYIFRCCNLKILNFEHVDICVVDPWIIILYSNSQQKNIITRHFSFVVILSHCGLTHFGNKTHFGKETHLRRKLIVSKTRFFLILYKRYWLRSNRIDEHFHVSFVYFCS